MDSAVITFTEVDIPLYFYYNVFQTKKEIHGCQNHLSMSCSKRQTANGINTLNKETLCKNGLSLTQQPTKHSVSQPRFILLISKLCIEQRKQFVGSCEWLEACMCLRQENRNTLRLQCRCFTWRKIATKLQMTYCSSYF